MIPHDRRNPIAVPFSVVAGFAMQNIMISLRQDRQPAKTHANQAQTPKKD